MQERLERAPQSMRLRRQIAEHPYGTIKAWMGATHFRMRTLGKVSTEMSLHVLAYNLKRMIAILGVQPMIQAIRAAWSPLHPDASREQSFPPPSALGPEPRFRTASAGTGHCGSRRRASLGG